MTTLAARHYGDAYDCDTQTRHYEWGNRDREVLYRGQLRLDAFLNRTVVVRDSSLIDGLFFWDVAGRSALQKLPLDRIEFRLRAPTIELSILLSFVNRKSDFLIPYVFENLSAAEQVRRELAKTKSTKISNWKQIPQLLKSFGADYEEVAKLESGWAGLIQLDETSALKKEVWRPFPFRRYLTLLLQARKKRLLDALSESGRQAATETIPKLTDSRSDAVSLFRSLYETSTDAQHQQDVATFESWYIAAYNQTCAKSHECDVLDLTNIPGSMPSSVPQRLYDAISATDRFGYPKDFIRVLGEITNEQFDGILKESDTALRMWYEQVDRNSLRAALDSMVELLQKKTGFRDSHIPPDYEEKTTLLCTSLGIAIGAMTTLKAKSILSRRQFLSHAAKGATATAVGTIAGGTVSLGASEVMKAKTARTVVERAAKLRSHPLTS